MDIFRSFFTHFSQGVEVTFTSNNNFYGSSIRKNHKSYWMTALYLTCQYESAKSVSLLRHIDTECKAVAREEIWIFNTCYNNFISCLKLIILVWY